MVRLLRSAGRSVKLVGLFVYAGAELILTRPATRAQRAEWLHRFCARAMRTLGIGLRLEGKFPEHGALISNHMGYLDIVAIAAMHRVVFVSKAELQQTPVLGWMTTMAGTVYVERGRGGSAERARAGLAAAAEAGLPVVFFPEGTTSNGHGVLQFHSGILAQMLAASEPVTAAFVRYRLVEPNGPGVTLEDDLCYWGDEVRLMPHVFKLLGVRGIEVTIAIADAPLEFSAGASRKQAAEQARAAVVALGGLRGSPALVDSSERLQPIRFDS